MGQYNQISFLRIAMVVILVHFSCQTFGKVHLPGFGDLKLKPMPGRWSQPRKILAPKHERFIHDENASSPVRPPQNVNSEAALAKSLVSGGVSWLFEFSVGHPVEYLKILRQTKDGSYPQLMKDIVSEKGVMGIWDGFFPWGTIQALAKGSVFGWGHAFSKSLLDPWVAKGTLNPKAAAMLSGGVGGAVQGVVMSPTLLLKTRVMTDPVFKNYQLSPWGNLIASFRVGARVVKRDGLRELMKGSKTFSAKRVMDWSTRYLFSELVEEHLFRRGDLERKLEMWESMFSSLLGGAISCIVTVPIDVAVAQIQQASSAGQAVSLPQIFAKEFQAGGWERVLSMGTRGLRARVIHVALTTMVMKSAASLMYEMLYKPQMQQPLSSHTQQSEEILPPEQKPRPKQNQRPVLIPQPVTIPVVQ